MMSCCATISLVLLSMASMLRQWKQSSETRRTIGACLQDGSQTVLMWKHLEYSSREPVSTQLHTGAIGIGIVCVTERSMSGMW